MHIKIGSYTVDINLDPGFYLLERESATGKTFLYSLLNSLVEIGDPRVQVMTFVSAPHTPYVIQSIIDSPAVLIMLDRFDRYANEVDLKALAKPGRIVLVDWKYPPKVGPVPFDVAFVDLRKDGVLIEM